MTADGVVLAAQVALRDVALWQPRPDVWLLVVMLYGGYRYAMATARPPGLPLRRAVTRGQHACFAAGVAVMWLATDGPVDTIGETYLFSVHMVQFLALTLVVPPLLLLGVPAWMVRRALQYDRLRVLPALTRRPIVGVLVFNAVIAFSHWPPVVALYLRSDLMHLAMHIMWVTTAVVWWWPVLSPLPELPHLSSPLRMAYLFGLSVLPTIPASFLTFGDAPLYPFYADAAPLLGVDALTDQRAAGLLMKIGGGLWLWGIIAAVFFRWSHEATSGAHDWLYARQPTADPLEAIEPP